MKRTRFLALALTIGMGVAGLAAVPADATGETPATSTESTCRTFTRTAYAYNSPHYPGNRRAELVLTVRACYEPDQFGLDVITEHSCSATSRSYRPRVRGYGSLYSTETEDYDEVYQRGLRCWLQPDGWQVFAQVGRDWRQTRPNRPTLFACPSVSIVYYAGLETALMSVAHDDFETRGNYNGGYSWRCPVWR